jgi:hypothetical protein
MKGLFFLSAIIFLGFPGCAGTPQTGYPAGMPVFVGVSGSHYLSKDRAITLALRDAARRVAFFHSVEVVIKSSEVYNPQSRISRVNEERELVYDTDYEKYIPLLEFDTNLDVYEDHGALFVHAVYTGETGGSTGPYYRAKPGKPSWIENPPGEGGGFIYAVGIAGPHLSYKDTLITSYEDAVYTFVKSSVYKTQASRQVYEHTMVDASFFIASGVVKGFHVVATYRDSESGTVWTLAAAREIIPKTEK